MATPTVPTTISTKVNLSRKLNKDFYEFHIDLHEVFYSLYPGTKNLCKKFRNRVAIYLKIQYYKIS